jgi:hypothetical protein
VPSDDIAQFAEVAREQAPERFRIEGEAEPRRVDDVGEEDRDCLADVRYRLPLFQHGQLGQGRRGRLPPPGRFGLEGRALAEDRLYLRGVVGLTSRGPGTRNFI